MKVFRSETANSDLLRIYAYLADRNPQAADAFIAQIDKRIEALTRFPFIGRLRSNLAPGLRSVVVGTHLVFYTVEPDRTGS
jgi:toxin ParE1/3/4